MALDRLFSCPDQGGAGGIDEARRRTEAKKNPAGHDDAAGLMSLVAPEPGTTE
jgi:hypothetical protein